MQHLVGEEILRLDSYQQFLDRITASGKSEGVNLGLLQKLPPYEELKNLESQLHFENKINFSTIFHEPVGNYLFRTYLVTEHSVDKVQ